MLKQIILNNYRAFAGENIINFNKDDDSQLTVITSLTTGAGKSTIIEAIYWCLYGENIVTQPIERIFNIEALKTKNVLDVCNMYVEMVFKDKDRTFVLKREVTISKKSDNYKIHREVVYINDKNINKVLLEKVIRKNIPKELLNLFIVTQEVLEPEYLNVIEKAIHYVSQSQEELVEFANAIYPEVIKKFERYTKNDCKIFYKKETNGKYKIFYENIESDYITKVTNTAILNILFLVVTQDYLLKNYNFLKNFPIIIEDVFLSDGINMNFLLESIQNKQIITLMHFSHYLREKKSTDFQNVIGLALNDNHTSIKIIDYII